MLHFSVLAHAADDNPNDQIKKLIKDMETYPGSISKDYQKNLASYYSMIKVDYVNTLNALNQAAITTMLQANTLQSDWKILSSEISSHPERGQSLSVKAIDTLDRLKIIESRFEVMTRELEKLSTAWDSRCGIDRLQYPTSFFSPKHFYPYTIDQLSSMRPQMPEVTIGVSVSIAGPNAGMILPNTGGGFGYSGTDGYIMAGSTVAGAAVAGLFSFGVAAPLGALIGSAIGGVLITVKNILINRSQMDEYHKLIDKLHGNMAHAVNGLSDSRETIIRESCNLYLSGIEGFDFNDQVKRLVAAIRNGFLPEIKSLVTSVELQYKNMLDRYLLSLDQLETTYFPELRTEYLGKIKEYANRLAISDNTSIEYFNKEIAPRQNGIEAAKNNTVKQGKLQHELSLALIIGDATIQPQKAAFFERSRFPTAWNEILSKVSQ